MTHVPNDLLSRLVGCRLYSVQFVFDYLQLHFDRDDDGDGTGAGAPADRPQLNCEVWPEVSLDGTTFRESDLGYADALRKLITGTVLETREATGVGLQLVFERGSVRLHPELEEVHAEIAMLSGFADRRWMVWRPGEDSFEDLVDFEVEAHWKEQVFYWEGTRGFLFDAGWGVEPPVLYVPPAAEWDACTPAWMHGRRDVILSRLASRSRHRLAEGPYPPSQRSVSRNPIEASGDGLQPE